MQGRLRDPVFRGLARARVDGEWTSVLCPSRSTPLRSTPQPPPRAPSRQPPMIAGSPFATGVIRKEIVMNKHEVKGKIERAKGAVKEKAGQVTNNPDLEAEGAAERDTGAVREAAGKAQRK